MRKKIQEKIQTVLSSFKKEKPAAFKTVEEVTEASRKAERLRAQANLIDRVTLGAYTVGALTLAGLAVAGVTVSAPATGAAFLGWAALMGTGLYQKHKSYKIDDLIFESKNTDGRYISRTYNEQEIAKFEVDFANKEKLEKKRDVLSKLSRGSSLVALTVFVGAIAVMTAGFGAAILQPAILSAWAVWGAGLYADAHRESITNQVSGAKHYDWLKGFEASMNALKQQDKAAEPGLANAPAAGEDFAASADKDAPKAEKPAQTPAAKPAPTPKGPSA